MTRLLTILLLVCGAVFAQIQDIPGTEAVGVSRQKIVDNFNYLNTGKAVATIGTVLPATCAYSPAGPVVLFVNTTGPTLSVCTATNVWAQVLGGGSVTWGQVLGTLSNQADLTSALAGKAALAHASRHQNGGADEIAVATAAANAIPKADASGKVDIGWVPTGQTGTTVALGNDARFSDARTPTAHAGAHSSNGSDAIAAATTTVRGTVTTTTANSQAVSTDDSRMTNARTPTAHAASHQNGGTDEIATTVAAANAIPKAGAGGSLAAGWIPDLSGTYTKVADKTGAGSKIASAANVPSDGCANWNSGNLGSTGVACGTGGGGITDLVQDLTPQLGGDLDMNGHNVQTVTPTEMTYLHGVTSAIQTQLGGKVASTDPRLSDARAPTAHASSHLSNGSDAIAAATTTVRGTVTTTTSNSQAVSTDDSRMTNARTPTAHAASHQNGGTDEIATATAAANAIPKAGSGAKLAQAWIDFTGYQTSLGYTPENQANKSTNTALGASDTLYPTQNAVKTYVDSHAGAGIVNQTTGAGPPSGGCAAPTAGNLTVYTDTTNQDEWFCAAANIWKKFLTTENSGAYVELGATGTAPANPSAGYLKCYFDSTAKTQICLDENGNAFIGVKGLAARVANQYMTYIDALGIQHQAQPDWTDLTNKPSSFTPAVHAASHKSGGSDEIATATPAASAIPKADGAGKLAAGWFPSAQITRTATITDLAPVAGDSGLILVINPATAIHLTRLFCAVQGTTNVVVNLDKRAEGTIGTDSTHHLLGSDLTAVAGGANTSTFLNDASQCGGTTSCAVAAHVPVVMTFTSVSGTPTALNCSVDYTVD